MHDDRFRRAKNMNDNVFVYGLYLIAAAFTTAFAVLVLPPLAQDPDVFGALAAGFVNPYAAGYSTDVIMCWLALALLVVHDRAQLAIRHGHWYLLLGLAPGVAVGLSLYLASRHKQLLSRRLAG